MWVFCCWQPLHLHRGSWWRKPSHAVPPCTGIFRSYDSGYSWWSSTRVHFCAFFQITSFAQHMVVDILRCSWNFVSRCGNSKMKLVVLYYTWNLNRIFRLAGNIDLGRNSRCVTIKSLLTSECKSLQPTKDHISSAVSVKTTPRNEDIKVPPETVQYGDVINGFGDNCVLVDVIERGSLEIKGNVCEVGQQKVSNVCSWAPKKLNKKIFSWGIVIALHRRCDGY